MHDTDTASSSLQHTPLKEGAQAAMPHASKQPKPHLASPAENAKPRGLLARVMHFFARLFSSKRNLHHKDVAEIILPDLTANNDRAAAARAAQMEPPVVFIGNSASTLVTPMGAYAGKPVEQAMRKRAEQQFRNMDVTQTTMN